MADQGGLDAFQWTIDLIHRYRVSPAPAQVNELKGSYGNPFQAGKIALLPTAISGSGGMARAVGDRFRWAMMPTPKHPKSKKAINVFNDQPNVLMNTAQKGNVTEQATALIIFLAGDVVQGRIGVDRGSVPVLKTLQTSDGYLKGPPDNMRQISLNLAAPEIQTPGYIKGWEGWHEAFETELAGLPVAKPEGYVAQHERYVEAFDLLEGNVAETADGWTVRFERQFPYSVDAVWASITAAAGPAPGSHPSTVGGAPPLRVTNRYVAAGALIALQPPTLLEYGWLRGAGEAPGDEDEDGKGTRSNGDGTAGEEGRVRWALSNGPGGARVVLTQTGPNERREERLTALAAWHTHLELLADALRGEERCWPAERTETLRRRYADRLARHEGTS